MISFASLVYKQENGTICPVKMDQFLFHCVDEHHNQITEFFVEGLDGIDDIDDLLAKCVYELKQQQQQQQLEERNTSMVALRARLEEDQAKLRLALEDAETQRKKALSAETKTAALRALLEKMQAELRRKNRNHERELVLAQSQLKEAQIKLIQIQNVVSGEVLSVTEEETEVMHGRSGLWHKVDCAFLDTGNGNVCTMSSATVEILGLVDVMKKSKRKVIIEGVIPGERREWSVIEIKLRIKKKEFDVPVAIGGDTPLLVSQRDVIEKLMEEGHVIGKRARHES